MVMTTGGVAGGSVDSVAAVAVPSSSGGDDAARRCGNSHRSAPPRRTAKLLGLNAASAVASLRSTAATIAATTVMTMTRRSGRDVAAQKAKMPHDISVCRHVCALDGPRSLADSALTSSCRPGHFGTLSLSLAACRFHVRFRRFHVDDAISRSHS